MMSVTVNLIFVIFNAFLSATFIDCHAPDEYVYRPNLKLSYKLYEIEMTWYEARLKCIGDGATLAMPKNEAEANELWNHYTSVLQRKKLSHPDNLFIGFHDMFKEGNYVTDSGYSLQYFFHTWSTNQPDNFKRKEHCGAIYKDGKLNDFRCDYKTIFMCQKEDVSYVETLSTRNCYYDDPAYILEPHSGKYYKLHMDPMTWNQARIVCHAEGGNLAMIESKQEEDFLVDLFNNPDYKVPYCGLRDYAYLGFHDYYKKGEFVTLTGKLLSDLSYVRWKKNEPNNHRKKEYCGSMVNSGGLNDIDCSLSLQFFCERKGESIESLIDPK